MSLTPSEWDAIQERAVNPFRSNESNAVNRLTRIITLGDNVILKDENLVPIDYKTIKVLANSYIKDDVYIQFDSDVNIDFTDEGNYYSLTDRGMNRPGTYYLTLHYVYNESIPNPIATFKILKNEEELTEQFLLLCECNVGYKQSDNRYEILSFDAKKDSYVHVQNLREKPDLTPTKDSTNPVSSGGVYTALSGKQPSGNYLTPSSTLDASKLSGTVPAGCYTNTTYSNMTAATISSGGAAGLVPASPILSASGDIYVLTSKQTNGSFWEKLEPITVSEIDALFD